MKEYEFEIGGGKTIVRGAPAWPDYLIMFMSRVEAIDLIANISAQLARGEQEIQLPLLGQMASDEEEE